MYRTPSIRRGTAAAGLAALLSATALSLPSAAQLIPYVGPSGATAHLDAQADDDGDGIDNALELMGFVYDPINGLQAWNGDPNADYFVTDPRRWSSDGDPYSDFMEVSGINMPGGVPQPYAHPLIAARPIITMYMVDYDVIPIAEITDSDGGSLSNSYTNSTTNEDQLGGSIAVEAKLNPLELAKATVEVNYSHTWSHTESTTNTSGTNWETATTTNTSEAARLKLRVFMRNNGSADATDVVPTFNLMIGRKVIATITSPQTANILSSAGSPNSRYPSSGAIVIDTDDGGDDIILSMDELRAIERGTPLSLVVTQVDANVIRWNPAEQQFSSEVSWDAFENEIDPVTMTVQADVGNGDRVTYQVFAGTQFYDPGFTLGDVFDLVFDVSESGGTTMIEGRPYPDLWYLTTDSDFLVDAWESAGKPADMRDLPAEERTFVAMVSPPLVADPSVNLASFSRDMRYVLVSAVPSGGFPILSVTANVTVDGDPMSVALERPNGFPFFVNPTPFPNAASASATVVVEDASGESVTHDVALPFRANATCGDVASGGATLPNPGAEYILFVDGDLDKPADAYCTFYDGTGTQLASPGTNFWLDRSTEDQPYLVDVHMTDKNTAVAVGSNNPGNAGAIYRTTDQGKTWQALSANNPLNAVDFLADGQRGVAVGDMGSILTTIDGGKTWQASAGGPTTFSAFESVLFLSADTVMAFGQDLHYVSGDGGATWSEFATMPNFMYVEDAEYNPHTGSIVAVGDGESDDICRSADRGATWQCVIAPGNLQDVSHAAGPTWFAVGWSAMYRSTDDGVTWEPAELGGDAVLDAVYFTTAQSGFALDGTDLYRTDDAGETWQRTETAARSEGGTNLEAMFMLNANVGMAVGDAGHVVLTTSGGGMPTTVTGVDDNEPELPGGGLAGADTASLHPNYPNPFSESTVLGFDLRSVEVVSMAVFDILGRRVATVVDAQALQAGRHEYRFNASGLAAGAYFYRLQAGETVVTRQMVVR